jgi:hypothetical protein
MLRQQQVTSTALLADGQIAAPIGETPAAHEVLGWHERC